MKAAFDDTAAVYDDQFTNSRIGRLQRNQVWNYLERLYNDQFPAKVLELNCGTGEDALFFARHGSSVTATDVSVKMLEVALAKTTAAGLGDKITTRQLDFWRIREFQPDQKYNLVFSNFGGLNCSNEDNIRLLCRKAARILEPGGRLIFVVMPRFCAWETTYYLSRFQFTRAFRRRKKHAQAAQIGNDQVDIWYHDAGTIAKLANEFETVQVKPIGITIPPSYFSEGFLDRKIFLDSLGFAEEKLNKFSLLARLSDHYLIDLKLR
ncbi:MAG TPA: class I SAM-dependent methyltransferase [Chitinophagaceae bacterium]